MKLKTTDYSFTLLAKNCLQSTYSQSYYYVPLLCNNHFYPPDSPKNSHPDSPKNSHKPHAAKYMPTHCKPCSS